MQSRTFAEQVVQRLQQSGFEAYWAGGCVRDLLLGIEPTDFDVATNAQPDQVRKLFGPSRTLPVGAAFGVIIVLGPQRGVQVEVATFRTESSYSDGRRPDRVDFSTAEIDAQRRDFTINGMFYDPTQQRVIDYVDGRRDLERRVVRAIGDADQRLSEDKLRMLRAVRIAARFGFEIEPATYQAIARHASETASVSGERLAVEMRKTLETTAAAWATMAWAETGLLAVLLPEVAENWPRKECGSRVTRMLGSPRPTGWLARLSCLLWAAAGPEPAPTLVHLKERLRFSNPDLAALRFALSHQVTLDRATELPWSVVQPVLISPWITTAMELLELRTETGETTTAAADWLRQRLQWPAQQLNPPPLLTGQSLTQAGLRPGPLYKSLLDQVRCLQLDGQLTTAHEALDWVQHRLAQSS